jgi:ABC-2 type transport system permease protein
MSEPMPATPATPDAGTAPQPAAHRGAALPVATATVAIRTVRKFLRTPQLVGAGTASGIMFLLIFRYVFGGAIGRTGSLPYVDFVVPGFLVTGVIFQAMNAASGTADDRSQGLVDRLRSLPIPSLSIVLGRTVADTALAVYSLALTMAAGFAVGMRLHGSTAGVVAGMALSLLWAFVFCWFFQVLGFVAGSPQSAQSLSMVVFPLTFVSSAYVPVASMPGWLQAFADHQPITPMVDTVRILLEGHAAALEIGHGLGTYLPSALAWAAGLLLICAPLTVWRLRKA